MQKSSYKPAWWCLGRHAQTLYPTLFRKPIPVDLQHQIFELPDGDFLKLAWTHEKDSAPLVVLLHGLEGSLRSAYAKGILKTIEDAGWQGVMMHFRGCGGQHNRLPRSYHSGDTGDLHTFLLSLRSQFPNRAIAAVGISLGGNVLLKYLGEQGNDCVLDAAMAISVPFDLADGAEHLNKGFAKIYQRHLVTLLREKTLDKVKNQTPPFDLNKLKKCKTLFGFDDLVTAPLHGFADAPDYYAQSSSKQFLKSIGTPTLILHSRDDPFMTHRAIPSEAELSPSITFELSEKGGHVGYVYGKNPFEPKFWTEKRLVEFFTDQFNEVKK